MKKIISMIGMGAMLCMVPSCKKSDVKPQEVNAVNAQQKQEQDTATLYVLLDSKRCSNQQSQYTSATVDIRGIKVYNTVHGWEDLTPVPGAWDVVSLQQATVAVADITEKSMVHSGSITKIALTFGTNNKLVVNDKAVPCYKIGVQEVVLDLKGEIRAGSVNELVVSIDICGNITVQTHYDQEPCYILNPIMAFESIKTIGAPANF
ncbi:MAG: DUF4382 domain-containing protein [Bacteroidia bacterium]